MKKISLAAICSIVIFTSTPVLASPFCDGWTDGYKAGYCYRQSGCIEPLVPLCPLPHLGENTYQDGYNRGFLAGLNSRQ